MASFDSRMGSEIDINGDVFDSEGGQHDKFEDHFIPTALDMTHPQIHNFDAFNSNWLVVSTPLKNMKVNGKIIPYIMENKKCLKPPTSQLLIQKKCCSG